MACHLYFTYVAYFLVCSTLLVANAWPHGYPETEDNPENSERTTERWSTPEEDEVVPSTTPIDDVTVSTNSSKGDFTGEGSKVVPSGPFADPYAIPDAAPESSPNTTLRP